MAGFYAVLLAHLAIACGCALPAILAAVYGRGPFAKAAIGFSALALLPALLALLPMLFAFATIPILTGWEHPPVALLLAVSVPSGLGMICVLISTHDQRRAE